MSRRYIELQVECLHEGCWSWNSADPSTDVRAGKYLNAVKESGSPVVRTLPSGVCIGELLPLDSPSDFTPMHNNKLQQLQFSVRRLSNQQALDCLDYSCPAPHIRLQSTALMEHPSSTSAQPRQLKVMTARACQSCCAYS